MIEVEDPEAFGRYQMHHYRHYGHLARVTFEPVLNMDAAFAPMVSELKRKTKK